MNQRIGLAVAAGLAAASHLLVPVSAHADAPTKVEVLKTYGDIALAGYEDSLVTAKTLKSAVDALITAPNRASLMQARAAWLAARAPYQQTEVYRFGNAIVDDWEGRVNAWPLDEGLIDYVSTSYGTESDENAFYAVNVIASPKLKVGGKEIDATNITPALLADELQEAGEVEANVATGYHAIEFLLWGQDLNGTDAGAGNRPATDFDPANCTGGNCDRRVAYLRAATDLLIADLEEMVANWKPGAAARIALSQNGEDSGLSAILTGMGSLSYGELAGERMKLGLLLNDPEEEHDCFADNTHNSHYYDVLGISNVYRGRYRRIDGSVVEGPSIADLVAAADSGVDAELDGKLNQTLFAAEAMVRRAESTEAYDQMIGEGNEKGNAAVQGVIDALVSQTKSIERAVSVLKLGNVAFEGSDSLDDPSAVFH
ncbi:imelysin family protein [Pelagibius sp. Alg239-R121]|uniref:imelysin family protein n=1 Tax=Pelagibius sp. Alg239-R121 TaxID=2993448 RepID=UPI0024A64647|nr:imelysin family protein [Pelagibius sp. Alg239-R121]